MNGEQKDFKNSGSDFAGPFVLYFSYGLSGAMFQCMVSWVIGGLADDFAVLRYLGFYKGVQSAGGAVAWQIDTHNVPYMTQLIVNWVLTTISYPLLDLLVLKVVKDKDKVAEVGSPSGFPQAIQESKEFNGEFTKSVEESNDEFQRQFKRRT